MITNDSGTEERLCHFKGFCQIAVLSIDRIAEGVGDVVLQPEVELNDGLVVESGLSHKHRRLEFQECDSQNVRDVVSQGDCSADQRPHCRRSHTIAILRSRCLG